MKLIIKWSTFLLLITVFHTSAQTLGQDAEGNSTVVTPATTLNLDISNSIGSFAFNREFGIQRTLPADILCSGDQTKSQNYLNSLYKKRSWLWGLEVKGELTNGISNLFTEDKVAAGASFGGVFGWKTQWTGKTKDAETKYCEIAAEDEVIRKKITINQKLATAYIVQVSAEIGIPLDQFKPLSTKDEEFEEFYKDKIELIKNYKTIPGDDKKYLLESKKDTLTKLIEVDKLLLEGLKKVDVSDKPQSYWNDFYINTYLPANALIIENKFNDKLEKPFDKTTWDDAHKKTAAKIQALTAETSYMETIQNSKPTETKSMSALLKLYGDLASDYHNLVLKKENYLDKKFNNSFYPVSALFYLRANSKSWAYTYDLANDSTKVSDRFVDRNFNGYSIEAGVTFNFRRLHYLGFSTGYNYASNLLGLTPTTFKFQKQDSTITEGQFTEVAEVKALSGTFDSFIRYDINCDYVYLLPLKEDPNAADSPLSNLYISINPYIRHRIYDQSNLLKNNTVLGLGLHAYSSKDNKIMGGIFVQTNDAFGVHAKEESTFGKRIVFGLIAKYNITGLKVVEK
jgi:hypothetical protein